MTEKFVMCRSLADPLVEPTRIEDLRSSDRLGFRHDALRPRPLRRARYDGDNKEDVAVYRPSSGTWYMNNSTTGFAAQTFGVSTDIPVPAAYHP